MRLFVPSHAVIAAFLVGTAALPPHLVAQPLEPGSGAAAAYLDCYREIVHLAPDVGRMAHVTHLVVARDAGQLELDDGSLWLLTPVGGRVVGAVFRGSGRFRLAPGDPVESETLQKFSGSPALDVPLTDVVLLFSDSTVDALRALTFEPGRVPGGLEGRVHDLIGSLRRSGDGSLADEVVGPLLNGENSGFFLAWVHREHADPLLFEIDPTRAEAVRLLRPVSRRRYGRSWAVVTEFPLRQPQWGTAGAWEYRQRLEVAAYHLDVSLAETFGADLSLAATATLALRAKEEIGPWLHFTLDPKLRADSARWGSGVPAPIFKAHDDADLWVRAPRRLATGDSVSLTISYHGNMIDRFANFFFINPSADWYPANAQGSRAAAFDLTFHSPAQYPLISTGERTDSTLEGRIVTTHWVMSRPAQFATFNVGLFRHYRLDEPGSFPVDVVYSDDAHRAMRQALAAQHVVAFAQRHSEQNVAADVSNALKLFTYLFGPCPYRRFVATEIPYPEGVSFPGMIDFGYVTFAGSTLRGYDAWFRAHETAHQWWGNGVREGSYHDKWLSEGLASFAALWYLQAERKKSDEYFAFLDRYRADIEDERGTAGPIWLGRRAAPLDAKQAYPVIVYEKGAWVFNMLRVLMLDLKTMGDSAFIGMMRDYYASFAGSPASTAGFERVVERHVGAPMGWFFDEWVRGTGMPTYRVAWKNERAPGGRFRVRLRVHQEGVPADFHMPVLVAADLGGGRTARFRVDVRGDRTEYESPLIPSEARSVTFDALHAVLADVRTESW
jgi:hypothetical protein